MRSFTTFTVLLTAVLSTFTNAAPITLPGVSVPTVPSVKSEVSGLHRELGVPGIGRETQGETAVGIPTPSVAVVFTGIFTQIQPLTEQLAYINAENATVAAISPVVAQIKTQLTSAVSQLQALIGQDPSVILAPVEGTVLMTVAELATLIAGDLCILFTALGAVLKVVVGDVRTEVLPMLADLGCDVTFILKIVVTLVGGIVASLSPLLAPVLAVIASLGLTDLLSLLGLSL
ncbi:hypothetical protein DEU56DRAFT_740387 [Suillus clintonianus]|uniref:uncharacterized protein n=1 Tax=Suillus clintonianus TaxID=1904413 RepID=UPI001B883828|nr:uncharacterized protein DEU56DRAFT_740387 [Suillus clintonianus]KAG2130900.1 hypothetical protein DEU56DRAFT_740387 [Suillus clintonianus]